MSRDNLPVIIGIGEVCESVPKNIEAAHSIVDICTIAAEKACRNVHSDRFSAKAINAIATTRPVTEYVQGYTHSFGAVKNLPRAVGRRLDCDPDFAVYSQPSGTSPQVLINEFSSRIASGEFDFALIVGGEVIANVRAAHKTGTSLNWADDTGGQLEDRGFPPPGVYYTSQEVQNDLFPAIIIYSLLENARRHNLNLSRSENASKIGELFHPFSKVAAVNPTSMFRKEFSANEIACPTESNYQMSDPYTKAMVAQDRVNQACAIILTSENKARSLGIDESSWIYLHGYCNLLERVLLERKDPAVSPAMALAYQTALRRTGIDQQDLAYLDLYSCFPIAVFNACDALGIGPNDPRGLTITGGLPFFGGAGNSYSLFGISGIVRALRKDPEAYGLVGTNGYYLSRHCVGIYSNKRPHGNWQDFDDTAHQQRLDAEPAAEIENKPVGEAEIVTYTVLFKKGKPLRGVIMGKMIENGAVFLADTYPNDLETPAKMFDIEPIGKKIWTSSDGTRNRFRF
jgi:acetyl-CoA C-acetyltransferase